MSTAFQAISVVGGVVPPSLLARVQSGEVSDTKSIQPASYNLAGTETVRDAASRSWMYLKSAWQAWRELDARKRPDGTGSGIGDARQKWLLVLLREFGYGQVPTTTGGFHVGDTAYPISHRWEAVPIHLLGPGVELDRRNPGVEGAARAPQAMVQEFLNREENYLWALLSNGLKLRLLRDSTALAGSAYLEFDLETIFDSDLYPEFQILWQLAHQSRLDKRGGPDSPPSDCWLESWRSESIDAGARALDKLGVGVEKALTHLGTGFLRHPDNGWLVDALHTGELSQREFHKALLRTAYRLLFCFVVEDRGALLSPGAQPSAHERYAQYFSTQRLRKMARSRDGGPHPDLWRTQKIVFQALGGEGLEAIGLPALGGLFDPDSRAARISRQPGSDLLLSTELANRDYLAAIRRLSWVVGKTERLQPVDYRHLGAEELGSVYESLLELIPQIDTESRNFELVRLSGNERKTTGSYYTPPRLVSALLDTALDPLLNEAVDGGADVADREARLLALTVCDPASGSGGFLVAAARRIARRLAEVRAGENEPTPMQIQHALHDVVERCIYGVDMNDLAAELAKVSLWLEAMEPGKPLGFLDARIKIGNSLLGTTPALLANGVPDEAFGLIDGDDKKIAAEAKKRNKAERRGQEAFSFGAPTASVAQLIDRRQELLQPVESVEDARSRAVAYEAFDRSVEMERKRLHADAWCAAFVWPLNASEPEPPTSSVVRWIGDSGESAGFVDTVTQVQALSREYRFFHWHLEFPEVFGDPDDAGDNDAESWPGGFSCMLGNPPWEHIELKEQEFFAAHNSEIAKAAGSRRKKLITELAVTDPILDKKYRQRKRELDGIRHFAAASGRYRLTARGRVKTDPLFAELFRSMTHPIGRTGIIVPTGIATDHTTQYFFKNLVETSTIAALYDFENAAPIFEGVHRSFKFCLLTMAGRLSKSEVASFAFFLHDPADIDATKFALSPDEIKLINPNTGTLPIFRTRRDAEITLGIYRRVPVLINENDSVNGNPWGISFMQGLFNMTSDSHLFHTREQLESDGWTLKGNVFERTTNGQSEKMLPLYEAKMIHQFDHRWATFEGADSRDVTEEERKNPNFEVTGRYWVNETRVDKALLGRGDNPWLIGWRNITNVTNERTTIAAPLPRVAVGHSMPLVLGSKSLLLAANLTSFASDYVARQKIGGTNFTFGYFQQLAVHPPAKFSGWTFPDGQTAGDWLSARLLELHYTANDMRALAESSGDEGEPFKWDRDRRTRLRAEIDALFFHLYEIDRSDVFHIMDAFPIARRKDEAAHGEYRTKRFIVEAYDAMQRAIDTGVPFTSTLNPPPGQGPRHSGREVAV